jgi:nitrogen fixation NifU-like protein
MDLEELYQTVLLDHSRKRRNYGELPEATHTAAGNNPSCGDEVSVQAKISPDGTIDEIKFTGQGCAISQASASLLTIKIKGKTRNDALKLERRVHDLLTSDIDAPQPDDLGDLLALGGVRQFPQRVKCAALAWNALKQILGEAPDETPTADPNA